MHTEGLGSEQKSMDALVEKADRIWDEIKKLAVGRKIKFNHAATKIKFTFPASTNNIDAKSIEVALNSGSFDLKFEGKIICTNLYFCFTATPNIVCPHEPKSFKLIHGDFEKAVLNVVVAEAIRRAVLEATPFITTDPEV